MRRAVLHTLKSYTFVRRMSGSRPQWQDAIPSHDNTHHILPSGVPLYKREFHCGMFSIDQYQTLFYFFKFLIYIFFYFLVLPFHPPGIAPVKDNTGSFHIDENGNPLYTARFLPPLLTFYKIHN